MGFREWLLLVEWSLVDPAVLDSYERAFQHGLETLIQRTHDPELRRTLEGMRRCPVRSTNGGCSRFTDYVLGALMRSGCHHQYDIDDSLQRICFRMLSPVGESGKSRRTIFDFDESRPFDLRLGNPMQHGSFSERTRSELSRGNFSHAVAGAAAGIGMPSLSIRQPPRRAHYFVPSLATIERPLVATW